MYNDDWNDLDDKSNDILISKGITPNDELNEIDLLAESLIDPIP